MLQRMVFIYHDISNLILICDLAQSKYDCSVLDCEIDIRKKYQSRSRPLRSLAEFVDSVYFILFGYITVLCDTTHFTFAVL